MTAAWCGARRRRSCSRSSSTRSSRTRTCTWRATACSDWDLSRADFDLFRAGIEPLADGGPARGASSRSFRRAFTPTTDTRAYLDWLLGGARRVSVAVELRHRSWSDEAAGTRAAARGISAALGAHRRAEIRSRRSASRSRRARPCRRGAVAYVRLHGRNAARWWDHDDREDRYNYLYSPDELAPFAKPRATRRQPRPARADVPEQSLLGEGGRQRGGAETPARDRLHSRAMYPSRDGRARYPGAQGQRS